MDLAVISKDERIFVCLIKTYTYVQYVDEFSGEGSFEIQIPINDESLQYLVFGNYIYFEDDIIGIIKGRKDTEDSDINITVYGYLSNHLLTYRSFLLTTKYYDTIGNIVRNMFSDLFVLPADTRRKISYFRLSSEQQYIPNLSGKVRIQNTGDNLFDVYSEILLPYDLGFELHPVVNSATNVNLEAFEMRFITPVDRTINNSDGNVPVVFSFDLDNVSDIKYEEDGRDYKTIAVVASEGEGEDRKVIEVGDTTSQGIDRIELYVDARDIQSGSDESGEQALSDLGGYEFGYTQSGQPAYKDPNSSSYKPFVSSSGHTIVNSSNTQLTQRSKLKIINATVSDDSGNDQTVITNYLPQAGNTTTLNAGQSASVTSRVSGSNVYFDFSIPKGDQGIQGEKGADGINAINGSDGYSPTVIADPDNTSDTYKLIITTRYSSYKTPNLKGADGKDGYSVIDSELSNTSDNPVKNKAITQEINDINDALNNFEFGYTDDGEPGYKTPSSETFVPFKKGGTGGDGYVVVEDYERIIVPIDKSYTAYLANTSISYANGYELIEEE